MFEVDSTNVLAYLQERGLVGRDRPAHVRELGGGVSNIVLWVSCDQGELVVKQSRKQLRTRAAWFSSLDRIYREVGVLRAIEPFLPAGVVPRVLMEDRENYLFAMEAAPVDHVVWKRELLDGRADLQIARLLGGYLAAVHRETAGDAHLAELLGDRRVFDELRLDPFYRYTAAAQADVRPALMRLIEETDAAALCVVLGDFSPKNVLVTRDPKAADASPAAIMLVDFETGHYGDPAFDLGFFLSHLFLKTILHAARADEYARLAAEFWAQYEQGLLIAGKPPFSMQDLERRTVLHLAACMLARVDGKSLVDYLTREEDRQLVRRFCRRILLEPPARVGDVIADLQTELKSK